MAIEVVFETHSITEDNEQGRATGWLPGRLSPRGRELARELGSRRRDDGIAAVFSSDLRRAAETASLAFLHASRCDHLDRPYRAGRADGRRWRGRPGSSTTCHRAGTGSEC